MLLSQVLFPLLALVPRKEVQHVASRSAITAPLLPDGQRSEEENLNGDEDNGTNNGFQHGEREHIRAPSP